MAYRDKEKQKEYARKHYLANKEKMIAKALHHNKKTNINNIKYVKEYLETHPCVDCGESNIIVLDFDHVRGIKKYNISNMKSCAYSIATIQKEIDKCEVRCSNCHRIATYNRRHKIK